MDVFVLNFPTKQYKNYVDGTYSFCAIVVRSTVNFDVQGDQRAHAYSNICIVNCLFATLKLVSYNCYRYYYSNLNVEFAMIYEVLND